MNIYDISEKAGVSIATVSRVLNGNSKVSEKTRERIMKVIEETGYQPNVFARGLGLNSMHTIGILCADSSDLVLAASVYNVEQELRKNQYDMLLSCTGYDVKEKEKCVALLMSKRVDGLIFVGSNFVAENPADNQYIVNAAKKVPVIMINGYLDAKNVYCTVCDDAEIMEGVMDRFLAQTDKVVYLYRSLSYSGRQKKRGVVEAMHKKQIVESDENVILFNGSIHETADMLFEKFGSGENVKVICTADDELAMGAYKYAKKAGLHVPEDLQIVGYNNSKISICSEPELTSIDNHLDTSSIMAVNLLMKVLAGEEAPARTQLCGEVIARGTTTGNW